MREDPHNHNRVFDRGNDLQLPAARAMLYVDVEHAFEQLRLTHPRRLAMRVLVRGFAPRAPPPA
jgi:hypothetical protein